MSKRGRGFIREAIAMEKQGRVEQVAEPTLRNEW